MARPVRQAAPTGNSLPFGIGEGGLGAGAKRTANQTTQYTPRHVPVLFNTTGQPALFWDDRVEYDWTTRSLTTPERGLNGPRPYYAKVVSALRLGDRGSPAESYTALAAQILFPMASVFEMRGSVVVAANNAEYWQLLADRLKAIPEYRALFKSAFPAVVNPDFNIGHAGVALAEFIRLSFVAVDTPFDRYVRGDLLALSESQKRGAVVFYSKKGKCWQCHAGPQLSDFQFKTLGTPQGGLGVAADGDDYGRFHVT